MDIVKIIEFYGIRLTKGDDKYYGSFPPIGQTGKSLHVWDRTNTWYCHKNHVGGGIIDFIEFVGGVDGYNPSRAYLKACEISGLQPDPLNDEEISKLEEKEEVYRTLYAAANIFHASLTEENYNFIFNLWGITKETADKRNLGYTSSKRNLGGFNEQSLIKTGLAYTSESGNLGGEYYRGRIVFPYIINGKSHYMSGREIAETPEYEKQSGAMKYKYLRIRSEKNTRISEFVNNHHFFGEDEIKNEKICFITEGLADCIVLNQYGFPSATLGSTNTSKENLAHLIDILKNKTQVYLCFDNDENQAGQKGALAIGQALFDESIHIQVIDLPRGPEKKIDVAEFMKGKQARDFEILKDKALRFIPYALSACHKSDFKVENLEVAEEFVKERLLNVDELYRNGYISDDIKRFFGFIDRDLTLLLKVVNSAVKNKQVEESDDAENNSSPKKDDVEILVIKSLETQNSEGLLACEKWITEFKLTIAKMQPESLVKKLMDPKERKYIHSNFICAVKDKFLLLAYETEEIYREILKINSTYHNEKRRLNKILIRLQNYPSHIREKADKLLLDSDPQGFIQATFKKLHIGDEMLADTLPVCVASTFLIGKNSGLPIKISGSSGKGKSSGVDAFLDLIPPYMLIKGGLSDKYLYYSDDMQAGSICFVDDKELSEPMKELVKNSITNFQKPEHHRTVINGEPKDLTAPERTVWIFASVDGFDDEQINNRLLQAEIDSSRIQDSKVAAFQRESENADISSSFKDDVETCKCIFDLIGLRTYDIRIPFSEAIIWNHEYNRRNQPKFFDIIRAVCLYKIYQRDEVNGYYLATIQD
jgi:DNA primase catalytic core